MSLLDKATLARDQDFNIRVRVAAYRAATQIVGEAHSFFSKSYFEKRQTTALKVLSEDRATLVALVWSVSAQEGISNQSTDTEIETAISAAINDIAGVSNLELAFPAQPLNSEQKAYLKKDESFTEFVKQILIKMAMKNLNDNNPEVATLAKNILNQPDIYIEKAVNLTLGGWNNAGYPTANDVEYILNENASVFL
ncbi:hypothetical protein AAG747_15485 [Rapidithrix thailandica]|uniref:Uncharacterized protein n=1 Tax=Rapidithrix thailandica TaxID=413964 RepID=A0AAW9SEQ0_9BACT